MLYEVLDTPLWLSTCALSYAKHYVEILIKLNNVKLKN